MVGEGEHLPRYEAQVKRLGLEDRVRFLKPMPARQAFALGRHRRGSLARRGDAVYRPRSAGGREADDRHGGWRHTGNIRRRFAGKVRPDAGELAARMAEALADPASFAAQMPDAADLRARFGANVMAAEIEKAYFAALKR